jgi:predicted ABC-type ATPase
MMQKKQLWQLAGGNGSGKSTFYETRLKHLGLPFVNADVIAKKIKPSSPEEASYTAAKLAEIERLRLLEEGVSFCFETVFSHTSKIDFIAQAKAKGYEIILIWIHLPDSIQNIARVSHRVIAGGHDVPEDKVRSRIERLIMNIESAIPLCDVIHCFDNSSYDEPFKPVFSINYGQLIKHQDPLPTYTELVLPPTKQ